MFRISLNGSGCRDVELGVVDVDNKPVALTVSWIDGANRVPLSQNARATFFGYTITEEKPGEFSLVMDIVPTEKLRLKKTDSGAYVAKAVFENALLCTVQKIDIDVVVNLANGSVSVGNIRATGVFKKNGDVTVYQKDLKCPPKFESGFNVASFL